MTSGVTRAPADTSSSTMPTWPFLAASDSAVSSAEGEKARVRQRSDMGGDKEDIFCEMSLEISIDHGASRP